MVVELAEGGVRRAAAACQGGHKLTTSDGQAACRSGVVQEGDLLRCFTTLGKLDNRKKQVCEN